MKELADDAPAPEQRQPLAQNGRREIARMSVLAAPKRQAEIVFHVEPGIDPMQALIAIMEACVTQLNQIHTADRLAAQQAEKRIVVPNLRIQPRV